MIDKGAPKNNSKNGQGKKSSFRSIGVSKMNPPNIIHSNNEIVPPKNEYHCLFLEINCTI